MKKFLVFTTFLFIALTGYSQTVYKTDTGKKYHKENCQYLKYSKTKVSLSDAISKYGLDPCKVCKPPKSDSSKSSTSSYTTKSKNCTTVQCRGTTQKGARCKRKTKNCNGYCYQHG